ncbi:hypothetical protein NMY22_g10395 [Coprinellus aureogranulatus]|nr:hypothetical protein NMY22_g10395 [Coprinellus aureogranulatus]
MDDFSKRRGLGFLALLWLLALAVYLVHHREQIVEECAVPMDKIKREEHRRGMRRLKLAKEYVLLIWRAPKVSWNIIISAHSTMLVVVLIFLHWSWTLSLGVGSALTWDRTQLSYGQVLSVFVPVPALFSFFSMTFEHRRSILTFLTNLPSYIGEGARFIFTGRKEWSARDDGTREWERDYFHWSRKRWIFTLITCFAYMGGQAVWIVFYVRAGSMPNTRIKINQPHKNWKPYSVFMYINGYICSIVGIFLTVAFFDFLPRWFNSEVAFTVVEQVYGMRPDNLNWQVYHRLVGEHNSSLRRNRGGLRALAFALSVVFAVVFCAGPVFAPYLALPLAQEVWHWSHDCDHYPVEIILNGQSNPFDAATISMYVTLPGSPKVQRTKMHGFKFYSPDQQSYPDLRVLEYIEPSPPPASDGSSIIPAPTTKALVLNLAQRKFAGCATRLSDVLGDLSLNTTTGRDNLHHSLESCTDGGGTFEKQPYLRFAITHSNSITNSTVYLRAESEEWAYPNDAPSFILKFDDVPGLSSVDLSLRPTSLRTALTKRNHPTILKMCSNKVDVTVDTLGPLSVAMEAMNRFAVFISRPRVLSDA